MCRKEKIDFNNMNFNNNITDLGLRLSERINGIKSSKINTINIKTINKYNKKDEKENKRNNIYNSHANIFQFKYLKKSLSNKSTKDKFKLIQKYNSKQKSNKKIIKNNINNYINVFGNMKNHKILFKNYDSILKEIKESKNSLKKLFQVERKELLYEIEYLFDNPKFNYDLAHQNDNNSNIFYINENFIDILLLSLNYNLILNSTIKHMKLIQKEITFEKRNILISWLIEINLKYVKEQNILFLAVKYIDSILYKENIDIKDFQLIGILCFNLALKLENSHKAFSLNEIISLIGRGEVLKRKEEDNLIKSIKKLEMKICDLLDFNLHKSTSVVIVDRLIQIMNINNKNVESIFTSMAYFFLELSIYNEQFYFFNDFIKALSSLLITKMILQHNNIKLGSHIYLNNCAKIYHKQINQYFKLCLNAIKKLKNLKYGMIVFTKYQMKNFNSVVNTYLNGFINKCFETNLNIV